MWICPFSALVGQKKTFVSWLAKEERREALSIPEAREGRGSEHGAFVCAARSCTSGIDRRSRTEPIVRPETNVDGRDQSKATSIRFQRDRMRELSVSVGGENWASTC